MSESNTERRDRVMADEWPVPAARPFGPFTYDRADSREDRWFKFAIKISLVLAVIGIEGIVVSALAFVIWHAASR